MAKDNSRKQSDQKNSTNIVRRSKTRPRWQERLLPTMNGLLIGLTIFFFLTTFGQMAYLHWSILQSPPVNINQPLGDDLIASAESFEERLHARELDVKSRMEAFIVTQRYHHASALLMSGLWLRYLGFITGMIIALVGASFVLGKLREPSQTLKGKFSAIDFSLRTTSPGIILVVLGALLMFATILDKDTFEVSDSNVYLISYETGVTSEDLPETGLFPPDKIFGTSTPVP